MPKTKGPRKKKRTKYAYIQGWGTYSNQTIVSVGMNAAEIARFMKRIKAHPPLIAEWEKQSDELGEKWLVPSEHGGMMWYHDGRTLIWFPAWSNKWDNFDSLTHEVSHLLDRVLADKKMLEETEARAYQAEYLHREIRRALWKALP